MKLDLKDAWLLYSTGAPRPSPLSPFPLSRYSVRVLLSTLWPVVSTESIYETSQTSSNTASLYGNSDRHLPGRHLTAPPRPGGAGRIFDKVLELLQNLGFTIKREKCSSAPTQSLVFLGGLLDSVEMSISLPTKKLDAIIKTAREILKDGAVTYKVLSSFLGRLSHAAQTGMESGRHPIITGASNNNMSE